jgi:hypothetical protein
MSATLEDLVREAVLRAMREHGWGEGGHDSTAAIALLERDEAAAPTHVHGRHSGSDFCIHCGGCMEPAVYERGQREIPRTLAAMLDRLDRFTELGWKTEPQDVRRLRQLTRPPMGRLPGVLYANFNLFWLGENVQSIRDKARGGKVPVEHLNELLAAACNRSAVRLSKWHLLDAIVLLSDVVGYLQKDGPATHGELKRLTEHLLIAIDRVQTWIDRMIPWHTMDERLELVP